MVVGFDGRFDFDFGVDLCGDDGYGWYFYGVVYVVVV